VSAHHDDDAFCRVVRCTVGRRQLDAIAGAAAGGRVVHPIEPPLAAIATDEPLLVLVAGLRRVVALGAGDGDESARTRLAAAREVFGEPMRAHILGVLAHAAMRADDPV